MSTASDDPFQTARVSKGVLNGEFHGEKIAMLLRHEDVRRAAKDWQTYSSDAPFRVPIPSEEDLRTVRQLPIETDPPEHTEYRALVEPLFRRAKDPAMAGRVRALVDRLLDDAVACESVEIVRGFALPLQSHALAYLLNVSGSEADIYISWGINALLDGGDGRGKGLALDEYLRDRLARAARKPGPDFFGELTRLRFRGRPLSHDEMLGFANLTFAGGRETIIQTIAVAFAHFAEKPDDLAWLRVGPERITHAADEFFRVASPLTQIGRVCPHGAQVHGVPVPPDHRVSLCWASANRDEAVFPSPQETRLDRRPNPHVAFGFGPHLCLGAPHARLLVRTLLEQLAAQVGSISLVEAVPHLETEQAYTRRVGFDSLKVRLMAR